MSGRASGVLLLDGRANRYPPAPRGAGLTIVTTGYDYLAFHAAERPTSVALIVDGREITYAQFKRDVAGLSRSLREFDLAPGNLVTVGCRDLYGHWLLLLAFERLGVVTASLSDHEDADCLPVLANSDLVLAEPEFPVGAAKRSHSISADWLLRATAGAEDAEPSSQGSDESPLRLVRTSGTTGEPKRLLFTRRTHDRRTANWTWCSGLTRQSRYLLTLPLKIAGSYIHATASIQMGATAVSESRTSLIQGLGTHGITHVTLLPAWLRQVLRELPSGFDKPADLFVASFGAPLPQPLKEEALARLATEVVEFYGSNEVGFVSSTRSEGEPGFGTVWPGAAVEIVGEDDSPLPPEALGRIRVRTDAMVDGYAGDPAATARMFGNGWFYPGDTGRMVGRTQLQVIARDDDLLNIGGNKLSPLELEELILRFTGVADVAAFTVREPLGVDELWVAVAGWRASDAELLDCVTRALATRGTVGRFHVTKVPSIPRTSTGKIQRHLLKEIASRAVQ